MTTQSPDGHDEVIKKAELAMREAVARFGNRHIVVLSVLQQYIATLYQCGRVEQAEKWEIKANALNEYLTRQMDEQMAAAQQVLSIENVESEFSRTDKKSSAEGDSQTAERHGLINLLEYSLKTETPDEAPADEMPIAGDESPPAEPALTAEHSQVADQGSQGKKAKARDHAPAVRKIKPGEHTVRIRKTKAAAPASTDDETPSVTPTAAGEETPAASESFSTEPDISSEIDTEKSAVASPEGDIPVFLYDSRGQHVAVAVEGGLFSPEGKVIGRYLAEFDVFLDCRGWYLGQIIDSNRLTRDPSWQFRELNFGDKNYFGKHSGWGRRGDIERTYFDMGFKDVDLGC